MAPVEVPELIVADAAVWRTWLDAQEAESDGVWLVLAKKGVTSPTSLTYAQALDEALCSGWIDGQKRSRDAQTFLQRFTPRRPRSIWSARNVGHIARLEAEGRMRERGIVEVEKAKQSGLWENAYSVSAEPVIPDDLATALEASPLAKDRFAASSKVERNFSIYQLNISASEATRARRIARMVQKLSKPEL